MKNIKRLGAIALFVVGTACSGGDKIVSPDALNNGQSGPKKLSTDDSLYVVVQMSGAAYSTITAFRNIANPPLPGLFGNVPPAPCAPAVTGNTDSNGNGIPDDKTTTYTAANCSYSSSGINNVVTGSIRQQDLGGVYGYRITYAQYSIIGKKGDSTFNALIDGSIEYAFATTAQARSQDNLLIEYGVSASTGSATLRRTANFATTFVPTGGNPLSRTSELPTGTLTLNGTLTITGITTGNQIPVGGVGTQTISMNIATVTPMNRNIGCSLVQSLNTGEMSATIGGSQTGAAVAKFTACGQGATGPTTPSGGGKK